MSHQELTEAHRPALSRGERAVLIAAADDPAGLRECLRAVLAQTPREVPVVVVAREGTGAEELLHELGDERCWIAPAPREGASFTAGVDGAIARLAPADVALLSRPCLVTAGWLERIAAAAYADTNTASASALADRGTALALEQGEDFPAAGQRIAQDRAASVGELAGKLATSTLALRPRLSACVGPCVYLRRDALELAGPLDPALELRWSLELDFAQRCLLSGLAHVAADDVLVGPLAAAPAAQPPPLLLARYPHLADEGGVAASAVLARALEAARRPRPRLAVTIDARALSASLTGTQRRILELIRALAETERLDLRVVLAHDTVEEALAVLHELPHTELLDFDAIDSSTPRSTVFHRPQQVFAPADVRLALRLGERIVLDQLDLIAYRNPGYHANATAWRSHRRTSRQALAAADRVVVFSRHTREELLGDELVEDARVSAIPPGLDHRAVERGSRPHALGEFLARPRGAGDGPHVDYLLCLGTDFRHKNRVFALRLLAALRERHGWDGRLVLAGTHVPHGSSRELERELLESQPALRERTLDLGIVEEGEKLWLMANAAAVVYPSVYEGFGLVPFEAGLCGTPCLFAARSSLAEVLPEGAAALVPWSVEESADRAFALLSDRAARAAHVQELARSARALTWRASAERMVELYEAAAIDPPREAAELSRDEVQREHELRELVAAQDALVAQLATERDHAKRMYDSLNAEVGTALGLIGPNGSLPADAQNALLALSARPRLSRPLFGAVAAAFRAIRALAGAANR